MTERLPKTSSSSSGAAAADAFERMPVAMMGLAGPEHRFVVANAAYLSLTGRTSVVGRLPAEVFPELEGTELFELVEEVYRTGIGRSGRAWRLPLRMDGRVRDVFVNYELVPVRATATGDADLLCYLIDVTAHPPEDRDALGPASTSGHSATRASKGGLAVLTLVQDALLPKTVPVLPNWDIAATYLSADDTTEADRAGGDWFDVIATETDTWLVAGDVAGGGVRAAATMSQLKAALAMTVGALGAMAVSGHQDGVHPLTHLDRYASTLPEASAATVCLARLDPGSGRVRYSTAGHPAPMVVPADGQPYFLPPTGGRALGSQGLYTWREVTLASEDYLVVYTNGLLNRPHTVPGRSSVEMVRVAKAAALRSRVPDRALSPAGLLCRDLVEVLVRSGGHSDDIVVVTAQAKTAQATTDTPDRFALSLIASPSAATAARRQMESWLERRHVGIVDRIAVVHACGEVVANAAEHAYPPSAHGPAAIIAVNGVLLGDGRLRVTVTDQGRWRPERDQPEERLDGGLGLALARGFVDRLDLSTGPDGTTVVMEHQLTRPATIVSPELSGSREAPLTPGAPHPPGVFGAVRDDHTLLVAGALDEEAADELRVVLQTQQPVVGPPLCVDLSQVTVLSTSCVQVLADEIRTQARIRLIAAAGSPAQHVLHLVQLPHLTAAPATEP